MSFPTKEERSKCWNARDQFWACLESNAPKHTATSGEETPEKCEKLRKLFEKNCPGQWVKHFDRKRTYELFKKKMEKGFDPLEKQQNP